MLYVDENLYIMQRTGYGEDAGLIYVLNNRGDSWNGRLVTTLWANVTFQPVAWWSKFDMARPINQSTDRGGRAQFLCPTARLRGLCHPLTAAWHKIDLLVK